ncbi:hypothetical protein MES5069_70296 [Mesorhizobium escarrei]|uniref:Uncharacterized protein n=1 Tax=Mesorhizobium escarrei TaxID=666018 RepID=A0ABM9EH27_9HYPH|nr:hypothetical protein MES5069_70296 [Mesorhizobium escarrei]
MADAAQHAGAVFDHGPEACSHPIQSVRQADHLDRAAFDEKLVAILDLGRADGRRDAFQWLRYGPYRKEPDQGGRGDESHKLVE